MNRDIREFLQYRLSDTVNAKVTRSKDRSERRKEWEGRM